MTVRGSKLRVAIHTNFFLHTIDKLRKKINTTLISPVNNSIMLLYIFATDSIDSAKLTNLH